MFMPWPSKEWTSSSLAEIASVWRKLPKNSVSQDLNLSLLLECHSQLAGSDYGVEVEIIVADFAKGREIYPGIEQGLKGKDLGILVNNVGVFTTYPMYYAEV